MTRLPPDLPAPEKPGPTIWAAREVRREMPTDGEVATTVALILIVAVVLIGALLAWAFA